MFDAVIANKIASKYVKKKYFINRHYQVSFVAGDKYATMDIDWENV